MALVKFMYGNEAQYTSLATKDEDALYFLVDSGKIYKGTSLLAVKEGVNISETQDLAGDTVYTLTVDGTDYSFYATTAVANKIAAAITAHNVSATSSVSGHVTLSDAINDTTNTASTGGVAATPAAVAAAVAEAESYTDSQIASVAGGMRFKGAVASAAEIQALTDVENGDTYRASAAFTFNGENVEEGDLLIASVSDGSSVYTFTSYGDSTGTTEYATGTVNMTSDTTTIGGDEYVKVVVLTNTVPEFVGQEFYVISSATVGNTLYQLYDTNSDPVDIWVKITGNGSATTTWYVFQANIDGAVTTTSTLTAGGLVLGNGGKTITILAPGSTDTILQMTANGPAWVTPQATDNTTYIFQGNSDGSFTVTEHTTAGDTPQTVSIGKPATAGTADQVAHTLTIGNQNFDGTADVTVGTTNAVTSSSTDLVTSGAVYDALVWQSLSNS